MKRVHNLCLYAGNSRVRDQLPLRVWSVLADLAWPVVTMYRTDLLHDARWLAEHVTGAADVTFVFGIRGTGTHIGTDEQSISAYSEYTYRVRVFCDERSIWRCEVTGS